MSEKPELCIKPGDVVTAWLGEGRTVRRAGNHAGLMMENRKPADIILDLSRIRNCLPLVLLDRIRYVVSEEEQAGLIRYARGFPTDESSDIKELRVLGIRLVLE